MTRAVLRDPLLPHQIVLRRGGRSGYDIEVTCNCMLRRCLAARPRWDDPREPYQIWAEHFATVGVLT